MKEQIPMSLTTLNFAVIVAVIIMAIVTYKIYREIKKDELVDD